MCSPYSPLTNKAKGTLALEPGLEIISIKFNEYLIGYLVRVPYSSSLIKFLICVPYQLLYLLGALRCFMFLW